MRTIQLAVLMVMVSGCGAVETGTTVSYEFPFKEALSSCEWNNLAGLEATLLISGHLDSPCVLDVNQSNYTVSGTCPEIVKGSIRYMVLAYHLPENSGLGGPGADLGYMLSYVDLSDGALAQGTTEVDHELNNNGVTSVLIYTGSDVNDLPVEGQISSSADPLEAAKAWAKSIILERQNTLTPLDVDSDECPNLHEVCIGTYPALDVTDLVTCGL